VTDLGGGHYDRRRGRVGGGDGGGPHAAAGERDGMGGCGVMAAPRWCGLCSQVEGSGCAELEWRLRVWVDGVKAWGVGAGGVVRALRGLVRRARVAALAAAAAANAGGGKAGK